MVSIAKDGQLVASFAFFLQTSRRALDFMLVLYRRDIKSLIQEKQMKTTITEILGYCSIEDWCCYEGTTRTAIDVRLSRGHWQRGVHVVKPNGGKKMVNLKAAKSWLDASSSLKG